MKFKKISRSVLTVMLSLIMVFEMIVPFSFSASAASAYTYEGGAGANKVVDLDTSTKYSLSLGDNASTEFSGRIWTDKSVYSSDVTFATYGGGESTIKLNDGKNGEDFLVAYSALATTSSVEGQAQVPVDVVFIVDISGSMSNSDSEMDNGYSRIANTVTAVNESINELMATNENTRIAVVVFSNEASVLLPLDHYTRQSAGTTTYSYLSLSSMNAGGTPTLTARGVSATEGNVTNRVTVSGGTNIQAGIYAGMNILATADDTTANVDGNLVPRVPSVVLLSDGAPTYSSGNSGSTTSNWWAPLNNNNDGPGSDSYYGNGFKALLTGAYMKRAIDIKYGLTESNVKTTLYTVGMGISDLDNYESNVFYNYYTGDQDLAYITLNPKDNWNAENDMAEAVVDAWTRYTNQTPGSNSTISVQTANGENYTVRHPANDIYTANDKSALQNLVDAYYDADNASAVNDVFAQIVSSITVAAPQVPTEIKGTDHTIDGYITYTDPIGEYMEVKDVKAIIYAGTTFTAKTVTTVNGVTTYTFSGIIDSAVYGHQELNDIVITVSQVDGRQTMVIKIPASVIPLRVNEVKLNSDGTVKSHTNNGAYPTRVIYSVGLQDEILKESDSGVVYVDRTKLSNTYVSENINADGSINFYSNLYKGNKVDGITVGEATVEFEPSHSNNFYYILADMPIYKDARFANQVTAAEGLDDDTIYYYRDEHYHGASVEITAIERTGAQLKRTTIKEVGGYLYRAAGTPRLNRILRFEGTKSANATHTAEDFYLPTFEYADDNNAYDGKFVIYLGNNGVFSLTTGGNLQITKTVAAAPGLTAPDAEFLFTVDLDGNNVNGGEYDYVVVNAEGATVREGTVSANNNTITLKDGYTATIFSLADGTDYEVTEAAVAGFATQSVGATGTINAGETAVAAFTNTYNVQSVRFPAQGGLTATKVLNRPGNVWTQADEFLFYITPYNNAPLPDGYDAAAGVVVDGPDQQGGNTATIDFGSIEFTAPGVYRYTVYEMEPENHEYIPGMTYSRALYRIVVTVEDNGDGTLSVTDTDIQKLYTDNAEQLFSYDADGNLVMNAGQEAQDEMVFVNSYNAESVTRVPVALKDYTDNSGEKPLVSGMFEFELKALGYLDANGQLVEDVTNVPMPSGAANGVITTTNEGHNITFPAVTFNQSDIPAGLTTITFRYQLREIAGNVYGMEYDDTVFTVDVIVSVDPNSHVLNVDAVYPGSAVVTFRNTYTVDPVDTDIEGTKTLIGRDMLNGEEFEFELGANAATALAIRNGDVTVPNSTVTISGMSAGQSRNFSFEGITFKKAGTYRFTVREVAGTAASMTYDGTVYTITVVVDDTNGDGRLEIVSNTADTQSIAFVNTYTSTYNDDPVTLEGTKVLTGKSLLEGEFYFDIVEYYNGDKVGERYVTHTADETPDANGAYEGTITFLENVTYDKAGTYQYVISEQIPQDAIHGTRYSEDVYRYTVVVKDDNAGNLYVAETSLHKDDYNASVTEIVFENVYTPDEATAGVILIKKVLEGDRATDLQADEFSFEISVVFPQNGDGIELPADTVVTNAANGDVAFDDITFTKPGLYVVQIKEVVPDDAHKAPGVEYSSQVITATYEVTDDRVGHLTAVLINYTGGETITNNYTATPKEFEIEINKDFTGRVNDQWLASDEFEFKVKPDADTLAAIEAGHLEMNLDANSTDTLTKKLNSAETSTSFVLKANKAGEYTFVITEVNNGILGVEYDTATYTVTVTIEDNTLGALVETGRTVKKDGADTSDVTFVNTYSAASVDVDIVGNKELTGRDLVAGDFTFELYETDNTFAVADGAQPTRTATNAAKADDGLIQFETITLHTPGTYYYLVKEHTATAVEGVEFDESTYKVTVVVADGTLGELVATVTTEDNANIIFRNTFTPADIDLDININKVLRKQVATSMGPDGFKFKLVGDGIEEYVETDAQGKAKFTFTYTAEDIGETFLYTVTEVDTQVENVVYSTAEHVFQVTIGCTSDGILVADITKNSQSVSEATAEFVNTYTGTPPIVPDTGIGANLWIWALLCAVSGIAVLCTARKKETFEN